MTSIRMQVATSDKDQSLKMHKKIQRKAPGQPFEGGYFRGLLENREMSFYFQNSLSWIFCKESKDPIKKTKVATTACFLAE